MDTRQIMLMSLSLLATPTPYSTQAPTSIRNGLPSFGISTENATQPRKHPTYT